MRIYFVDLSLAQAPGNSLIVQSASSIHVQAGPLLLSNTPLIADANVVCRSFVLFCFEQAIFKMQEAVVLAKKVDNYIQEHMRTLRKKQIAEMEKVFIFVFCYCVCGSAWVFTFSL